ncbi:MAG: ABC transporter ATP-binding protein [Rhizobacter sp.]
MLELQAVSAFYGAAQVLWDVSLKVGRGEVVALIGANGSGKSSVLKAAMGLMPKVTGHVLLNGDNLRGIPAHQMVTRGVGFVLERRRLFPQMTVEENLLMGAYTVASRSELQQARQWVEDLLPVVAAKRHALAGRLSGGEQQMVAIARGLMTRPSLLLLDEPFLGLAPRIVDEVADLITRLNGEGVSILFNEQNVGLSFSLAHRGYLLKGGRVVFEGSGPAMADDPAIREAYLGQSALEVAP